MRRLLYIIGLIILVACAREPLELYVKGDSESKVNYNKDKYDDYYRGYKELPDHFFVMYAKDGDSITERHRSDKMESEDKSNLDNGTYQMLVMTNDLSYYEDAGNMRFYNKDDYENIYAVSEYYNSTELGAWDYGMRYMQEPLKIAVAVDSFDVNKANDGNIFYQYDKNGDVDRLKDSTEMEFLPMTTTLRIKVRVNGINFVRKKSGVTNGIHVEAYITGMANGFYLTQFWRTSDVGNLKLTDWYTVDRGTRASDTQSETGYIYTYIETFGLPRDREMLWQRSEQSNFLKIHLFSIDPDKDQEYSYYVGKNIRYLSDKNIPKQEFDKDDINTMLNVEIDKPYVDEEDLPTMPYAQPDGSGQFGADVAPWGNEQEMEVPMSRRLNTNN